MRWVQEDKQRLTERQEPFVVAVPQTQAARLVEHTTDALVLWCEPVERGRVSARRSGPVGPGLLAGCGQQQRHGEGIVQARA